MQGIYAIVDVDTTDRAGLDAVELGRAVLRGGIAALQLRAKGCDGARFVEIARALSAAAREAAVPFFINDRADVACLIGAHGVHVGQTDLSVGQVRALGGASGIDFAMGLSTHDEAQLEAALSEPLAYVAVGPVFDTVSKARPDPVLGVDRVKRMAERARSLRPGLPLLAIGGIDVVRVSDLAGVVDLVAVIGALVPSAEEGVDGATRRTKALVGAFRARGVDRS